MRTLTVLCFAVTAAAGDIPQAEWRARILATLHAPDPLPALALRHHGAFTLEQGITVDKVSYSTQLGMRVPAIVYSPTTPPAMRRPALIVVNGHGGDKFAWYAMYAGLAYARLGAVVLTYDPAGEGERNADRKSGTRSHDRIVPPEENGRYLGGLMLTDVRQAVSYLVSRPDVDPARIAAVGYSMGSFVLSIACAVETRLKACVLAGGGNLDGPGEYWDKSKAMCQGTPYRSLAFLGDRAAAIYAMHALRGATLLYNGTADTVVNMHVHGADFVADMQRRTAALVPGKTVFDAMWEQNTSHRPYFVTKPVARWLHGNLQFPSVPAGGWDAIPQRRIADWAREHNVPMDSLYATYDREGGTLGLWNNLPGIARDQLMVYTAQEWEKARDTLTHEAYLSRLPKPKAGR
ncbi:MAG: prolyl oligopeptidase family serine peptidase [Acidobacteria bacterium]|nr:prolyl oligopeptidase family serine peptidase [Acidobacteriota bacterium]